MSKNNIWDSDEEEEQQFDLTTKASLNVTLDRTIDSRYVADRLVTNFIAEGELTTLYKRMKEMLDNKAMRPAYILMEKPAEGTSLKVWFNLGKQSNRRTLSTIKKLFLECTITEPDRMKDFYNFAMGAVQANPKKNKLFELDPLPEIINALQPVMKKHLNLKKTSQQDESAKSERTESQISHEDLSLEEKNLRLSKSLMNIGLNLVGETIKNTISESIISKEKLEEPYDFTCDEGFVKAIEKLGINILELESSIFFACTTLGGKAILELKLTKAGTYKKSGRLVTQYDHHISFFINPNCEEYFIYLRFCLEALYSLKEDIPKEDIWKLFCKEINEKGEYLFEYQGNDFKVIHVGDEMLSLRKQYSELIKSESYDYIVLDDNIDFAEPEPKKKIKSESNKADNQKKQTTSFINSFTSLFSRRNNSLNSTQPN